MAEAPADAAPKKPKCKKGFKVVDANGRGRLECWPTIKQTDAQRAAETVASRLVEPARTEEAPFGIIEVAAEEARVFPCSEQLANVFGEPPPTHLYGCQVMVTAATRFTPSGGSLVTEGTRVSCYLLQISSVKTGTSTYKAWRKNEPEHLVPFKKPFFLYAGKIGLAPEQAPDPSCLTGSL